MAPRSVFTGVQWVQVSRDTYALISEEASSFWSNSGTVKSFFNEPEDNIVPNRRTIDDLFIWNIHLNKFQLRSSMNILKL